METGENLTKVAYSVSEIAEITSLSKSFVRKEIDAGHLPARRFGRRVVVFASDFENYLDNAPSDIAVAA